MDARQRLVDATAERLWEAGYAATSPAEIQRAARAGQGSMYHHFSGKAELAAAAIEQLAAGLLSDVDADLDRAAPGVDRVLAYLEREREPLRGCRVGRLTADPAVLNSEALRLPVGETFAVLQKRLADELAGEVDDPADVAAAVVATVQGGYVLARAQQDPAAFESAVRGAAQLLATNTRSE